MKSFLALPPLTRTLPLKHWFVDVSGEWEDHSLLLDLVVKYHSGGDGRREADGGCHGRVAVRLVAPVVGQVDAAVLATVVRPPNHNLRISLSIFNFRSGH